MIVKFCSSAIPALMLLLLSGGTTLNIGIRNFLKPNVNKNHSIKI